MSWTERMYLLLALLIALPFVASAQWDDEEEACSAVLEGKALKLYEKGINGSKYDRAERVAFLEEAFDRADQCMACLFEWGRLEFNSIKRSRGSFYPAQQPLLQLIDACPFFRAEAWYMLGAMAYADSTGVWPGGTQGPIPVAIGHGTDDTVVPYAYAEQAEDRLTAAGWPVDLWTVSGGSHAYDADHQAVAWAFVMDRID